MSGTSLRGSNERCKATERAPRRGSGSEIRPQLLGEVRGRLLDGPRHPTPECAEGGLLRSVEQTSHQLAVDQALAEARLGHELLPARRAEAAGEALAAAFIR